MILGFTGHSAAPCIQAIVRVKGNVSGYFGILSQRGF